PELLDLLADRFKARRYDVKWLLREIALSRTYQRSSEAPAGGEPSPDRYLAAAPRPLSPEQFAYAVLQATGFTDAERLALGKGATDAAVEAKQAPHDQALFLKHGGTVRGLTAPRAGNTADRVLKAAGPAAAADELFLSVLTRYPTADERREAAAFLTAGGGGPAAVAELEWALLTSAEFRFNH